MTIYIPALLVVPIIYTLFLFVAVVITFLNNPYRVYAAKKEIDKALKEHPELKQEQKEHDQQQKIERKLGNKDKILPLESDVTVNSKDEKSHDQKPD